MKQIIPLSRLLYTAGDQHKQRVCKHALWLTERFIPISSGYFFCFRILSGVGQDGCRLERVSAAPKQPLR